MVASDFFVPGTRSWDRDLIEEVFSEEDAGCILKTSPSPNGVPDKIIWHFSPKGIYSVKTVYHLAARLISDKWEYSETKWKSLWKMRVPPKIKSFFWRLCKGWLAVRQKLSRWYAGLCPHCTVCVGSNLNESTWHLFVDCRFVVQCWKEWGLWDKLIKSAITSMITCTALFLRILEEFDEDEAARAMTIAWSLWRHRNSIVWEGKESTAVQVVFAATAFLAELSDVRQRPATLGRAIGCDRWHPPQGFHLKVSVDASFETGIGMVARNSLGECLAFRSLWRHGLMSVDEGEAWGVCQALKWAVWFG